MVQQGQVVKLKAKGANGQALWAYRYRLEGRGSSRPQVGLRAALGQRRRFRRLSSGWVLLGAAPR